MSTLSTHVLDTALGKPAAGIAVTLGHGGRSEPLGPTDADGRVRAAQPLPAGDYQLTFSVGEYFAASGRETFYRDVVIQFHIADGSQHYHVPLLITPFGYSTYRGS